MQKLSIVIPVYNEEKTLAACVRRVMAVQLPLEKELILVNDGSTDRTRQEIEKIRDEFHAVVPVKVIEHPRNMGKGASLRSGFAQAQGDVVLIQDADLEYDPRDYPRLLRPILDGRADAVYGSRFIGSEEKRVLFFWHYVGNKFLTCLSNMCTNLNLTDMETCYKVFRAEVLRSFTIKSNRFGVEPELTAKIAKRKFRVYEVGISYSGRDYSEGKKITWKDGLKALFTILRFRLRD